MSLHKLDAHEWELCIEHDGEDQHVTLSPFNAARVLLMIAQFLGIELPKRITREINIQADKLEGQ